MRTLRALLAVVLLTAASGAAQAGPVLSVLPPSGVDLTALTPGQTVTFTVHLDGLAGGDSLNYLAAIVYFDPAIFGSPMITPGPIVPDPAAFVGTTYPDAVDGNYDALIPMPTSPITANGTFWSFALTVQGTGSGSVAFSGIFASGTNGQGDPLPPPTASSPSIDVAAAGTPEPGTAMLLAAALAGGLALYSRRRRAASPPPGASRTPGR